MTQSSGILTCPSQSSKNPNTEFFKQVMRDSGIKLMSNDDPNVITQEQALVVRDIDKIFEMRDSQDNIDMFIRGFKILIKKEKYLVKALLPTVFKKSGNHDGDVEIQQESLFRILLKVTHTQKETIDILLDELTSTISDDEADVSRMRLLLSQLRYLPHIKHPENLTTKLLDIIEIASYPCQLEILDSIPEVLPDSEYSDTAKELTKMLDKEDDLAGAIIDCLNALSLNSDIRAQIQDHILAKILTGASTKIFPVFLDFLLSDCNAKTLSMTLGKIRNALNIILAQDRTDKDKESAKIVIFNRLQKAAVLKVVCDSWVSVITNIKTHTDHKPVDLLILFMLYTSTKLKKRTIETTFRKRVKDGQFKCSLLEQLFEKYLPQQLLRDYFVSIIEIAASLLRGSEDPIIVDFATTLYKLAFTHEYTGRIYRQEILENIILLVGANDQKNVTTILNILVDLLEDIAKAPNHAIILMRLLEKLETFELEDVKLVFEILCRLTCHEESLLGLKEELHMIIRKHLSSAKRSSKYRGVVSAVVMAKHVATTSDDQSDFLSEDSITTINQLQGAAKEAAAILELAQTSAKGSPELTGLYYDQLASVLNKSDTLDKHFLAWLFETVTADFQNMYVTESVCDDFNDLQFSMQYNLNSEEEVDTPLAVNIAELTLKSEHSILVLAPHFRLLRLLHFKQQNGDLSSIDALLGCGVVLPKLEQRDSLDSEQVKQMSECLFHCINWFRETVSGFVLQKNHKLRVKIIQRIENLYELEKLLAECSGDVPGLKLPQSYFDVVVQTVKVASPKKETKAPRKKLKTREIVEDTTVATTSRVVKPCKKSKDEVAISFREMDTDVVKLLKYPLRTDETSSDQVTITLNQFNFLLKDYVKKLALVTKRRHLGLSHLTSVSPSQMMTDCSKVLMNLSKHLSVVLTKLEDDEAKTSFGLVIECLSLIFSWSGFQHTKHLDLLRETLKAFRSQDSTPLNSVNHLIIELVNRLADYGEHCSSLTQAVDLIRTLEALHGLSPSQSIRSKIAKTAGNLLNKEWKNASSANIDVLIRSYLSSASTKSLCGMVATLHDQVTSVRSPSDSLEMLKSVTKSNFYVFYRNLWTSLHERVKLEIQSLTNAQHLSLWRTVALTMQGLMTVAKAQETKANLACFLKKSIAILKIFLSHGIPLLEIELKSEPDRVVEIFKTIQSNTRFLHHLCCYSKLTKDTSLMAYVPQFRLTLESLVYRVKAALVANGCSDAFWMGNLKNRDLQGEDILTQSTENSTRNDDEEEDQDEEMASDDDLEDRDNLSGSEVFQ